MKQKITVEQLNELTEKQRQRLRELREPSTGDLFYAHGMIVVAHKQEQHIGITDNTITTFDSFGGHSYSNKDCLPLLNIGQMIEIVGNGFFDANNIDIYKLCDALWQEVKRILS